MSPDDGDDGEEPGLDLGERSYIELVCPHPAPTFSADGRLKRTLDRLPIDQESEEVAEPIVREGGFSIEIQQIERGEQPYRARLEQSDKWYAGESLWAAVGKATIDATEDSIETALGDLWAMGVDDDAD